MMMRCSTLGVAAVWTALAWPPPARAQPAPQVEDVAATVDQRAISWRDVQRQVERTLRGRPATQAAVTELRRAAREQLISRELILSYLDAHQAAPSEQDIDVEIGRIRKRLALEEKTLEQHLRQARMTMPEFRSLLRWQLGWQWYLDRYLTDANLQKYFGQHRRDFDGTRLRVAQILFKTDPAEPASVAEARRRAAAVREKIQRRRLAFAAAAKQHSDAPSGAKGGDIGWIERRRPMQESFSRAAFELQQGEVSEPVTTPVGVHLIQCLEVEPGQRAWDEVREPLQLAVTTFLFDWIADQQRDNAKITRSENFPPGAAADDE